LHVRQTEGGGQYFDVGFDGCIRFFQFGVWPMVVQGRGLFNLRTRHGWALVAVVFRVPVLLKSMSPLLRAMAMPIKPPRQWASMPGWKTVGSPS